MDFSSSIDFMRQLWDDIDHTDIACLNAPMLYGCQDPERSSSEASVNCSRTPKPNLWKTTSEREVSHGRHQPRDACIKASDLAHITFFLKHTGPTPRSSAPDEQYARTSPATKRRSVSNVFKRWKSFRHSGQSDQSAQRSSTATDPSGNYELVQRTLSNGRAYYQITPSAEIARQLLAQRGRTLPSAPWYSTHTPDSSSLRTETADTDVLDHWLTDTTVNHRSWEVVPLPKTSRGLELARTSSDLRQHNERYASLDQYSEFERSWSQRLPTQHLESQEQLCAAAIPFCVTKATIESGDLIQDGDYDCKQPSCRQSSDSAVEAVEEWPTCTEGKPSTVAQVPFSRPATVMLNANKSACSFDIERSEREARFDTTSGESIRKERSIRTRERKMRDLRRTKRKQGPRFEPANEPTELAHVIDRSESPVYDKSMSHPTESVYQRLHSQSSCSEPPSLDPSPELGIGGANEPTNPPISPVKVLAEYFSQSKTKESRRMRPCLLPAREASGQLTLAVGESIDEFVMRSKESSKADASTLPTSEQQHWDVKSSALPSSIMGANKSAPRAPGSAETDHLKAKSHHQSLEANRYSSTLPPLIADPLLDPDTNSASTKTLRSPNKVDSQPINPPGNLVKRSSHHLTAQGLSAQLQRASFSSSRASTGKQSRLEARIELLERENRLLEAALMAVLKTGGKLNGCPCGLNSGQVKANEPCSDGALMADDVDDTIAEQPSKRAQRSSSNDVERSPLSVYLETRANGVPMDDASSKPH